MQRDEMLELYDRQMRLDAPLPGAGYRHERVGTVLRLVGPSAATHDNCIMFSRLDAAGADAAIRGEIGFFGSLAHGFEWKLHGHDQPDDLADRLLRHGFTAETPETILIRDLLDDQPPRQNAPPIDIRRIDRSGLPDLVAVQNAVWNEDNAWFGDRLATELAEDAAAIEILVGYVERRPVATSLMRLHGGTSFASLWAAATLPAFQRRGIYSRLVERHATAARAAGVRLLQVDANENSRPVLERVGFRPLVKVQGFVWQPAG